MLSPDTTFNTIIDVLQSRPNLTMNELYHTLSRHIEISLPNLYKIIADLINKQIILKYSKKLSLHPLWIAQIKSLHDTIILGKRISTNSVHVDQHGAVVYTAGSIRELDTIWFSILQYCVEQMPERQQRYFYNFHAYHILGMYETESNGFKTLSNYGQHPLWFLIGNTTYLDQYAKDILSNVGCRVVCREKTWFPGQGYHLNMYGDYIVEVAFPQTLCQYFEVYYQTVQDIKDFPQSLFSQLFDLPVDLKIRLSHDPRQATIYRQQFDRYFIGS